jgi:molecular chaperone GrpE
MTEKDAQICPDSSDHNGVPAAPSAEGELSVADLMAQLAVAKDRLLRALAEQENIRGLARRDRDEAVRYAASGFAGDLLSSIDNLERAIASVPQDRRSEPAFAKHGLTRFDPIGESFDPHRHEASFEAADARYPPGTVTHVIQPGYMHCDRLLRPALVGISKTPDT